MFNCGTASVEQLLPLPGDSPFGKRLTDQASGQFRLAANHRRHADRVYVVFEPDDFTVTDGDDAQRSELVRSIGDVRVTALDELHHHHFRVVGRQDLRLYLVELELVAHVFQRFEVRANGVTAYYFGGHARDAKWPGENTIFSEQAVED